MVRVNDDMDCPWAAVGAFDAREVATHTVAEALTLRVAPSEPAVGAVATRDQG